MFGWFSPNTAQSFHEQLVSLNEQRAALSGAIAGTIEAQKSALATISAEIGKLENVLSQV